MNILRKGGVFSSTNTLIIKIITVRCSRTILLRNLWVGNGQFLVLLGIFTGNTKDFGEPQLFSLTHVNNRLVLFLFCKTIQNHFVSKYFRVHVYF